MFSGGFPDSDGIGVKSLTLYNSKNTNLLSLDDSIIQFLCLPLTPFVAGRRLFLGQRNYVLIVHLMNLKECVFLTIFKCIIYTCI